MIWTVTKDILNIFYCRNMTGMYLDSSFPSCFQLPICLTSACKVVYRMSSIELSKITGHNIRSYLATADIYKNFKIFISSWVHGRSGCEKHKILGCCDTSIISI